MTPYLSPTAINTYHRCPKKYFLKYIKGMKEKPNIHLITGMVIYEVLARFHRENSGMRLDRESAKGWLSQLFDDSWRRHGEQLHALGLDRGTLEDYHQEGARMLMEWLDRHPEVLDQGFSRPDAEVKLFSQRYGLMGVIDAIHRTGDEVILTDYKTGKNDTLTSEIKVQMAIYALLYKTHSGTFPM